MKSVRHSFIGLVCLGALTLFPSDSRSTPPYDSVGAEKRHYWVNLGGGFCCVHGGLGEDDGGVSGGIGFSYRSGGNLFSFRAVGNSEFKLDLWGYSGPPDKVWDVGVLYGRITKSDRGMASLSGGVGIVGASDYGRATSHRVGIPIEAQLFWIASDRLGLGIYGFANVNSDRSFAGALFCLQIGKLR